MTQRFSLFEDLKVRENLEFLAAVQGLRKPAAAARVHEFLHAYHLHDRAEQTDGTLSAGRRQRLALAGAVIHTTHLLPLDEPHSAVHPEPRPHWREQVFDLAS